MSQSKHTPGPWFVFPGTYCVGGPFVPDPGDDPGQRTAAVAVCGTRLRFKAEAEANARLIAAAPDLLAACEEYLALAADGLPDTGGRVWLLIQLAVHKARLLTEQAATGKDGAE